MSLVEWTRLEPGQTEGVIAVMLCRRNRFAVRIRPSRGDGGIDILVPGDDGWHVYQVKYFFSNLTSSQKRQAEESYNQLLNYISTQGIQVAEWHLVMPLDPTKENLFQWLADFTKEAPFRAHFNGLSFVDGLAAEFPDVIDYYLHDGTGRVAQATSQLVGLLSMTLQVDQARRDMKSEDSTPSLAPSDLIDGMHAALGVLNESDPHFSYGISADPARPSIDEDEPGLVAAVQSGRDGTWVTVKVYARYEDALNECPIPVIGVLEIPDHEAERALEDFRTFGVPATLPTAQFAVDLPGGLGGSFSGGSMSFGPSRPDSIGPYVLQAQTRRPDGTPLETVRLTMDPITQGPSGEGVRAHGIEEHGTFELELRLNLRTQETTLRLQIRDLTGRPPSDVLPGLRFVQSFASPNELYFAPPHGPIQGGGLSIRPPALDLGSAIRLVEAFVEIQNHTTEQIILPDFGVMDLDQAKAILELARLLRHQSVEGTWNELIQVAQPGAVSAGQDVMLLWNEPVGLRQEGRSIWLGHKRTHLRTAHVAGVILRADGKAEVRFVPGVDPSMEVSFIPGPIPDGGCPSGEDTHFPVPQEP